MRIATLIITFKNKMEHVNVYEIEDSFIPIRRLCYLYKTKTMKMLLS
jgi:hypothetical protein